MAYQEQISQMVNPERPLKRGLVVSLMNLVTGRPVRFNECDEKSGTMIEAKGPGFADQLRYSYAQSSFREEWTAQATRQVEASQGRLIRWYFAEAEAAALAREIFRNDGYLKNIIVIHVPADKP